MAFQSKKNHNNIQIKIDILSLNKFILLEMAKKNYSSEVWNKSHNTVQITLNIMKTKYDKN